MYQSSKTMGKSIYELHLEQELERERQERRMERQLYEIEEDKRKNDELLELMSQFFPQPKEEKQEDEQPVEVPPQQPQQSKEPLKVISGTSGLAEHLGCSRSKAFDIIKSGVLIDAAKDAPIQYRVGKEWKFNREELDKYHVNHPELLKNVMKKK